MTRVHAPWQVPPYYNCTCAPGRAGANCDGDANATAATRIYGTHGMVTNAAALALADVAFLDGNQIGRLRLVKLRHSRGLEWGGDWGDASPLWAANARAAELCKHAQAWPRAGPRCHCSSAHPRLYSFM